jgi:outer membrane receptor protein involved in Fe transport
VTVEVVGTNVVVHTALDGKYTLEVPPGSHEVKVSIPGYQPKTLKVDVANTPVQADVTLSLEGYSENITVTGQSLTAETSTAAVQLLARERSPVIQDNLGATEMKQNADADAAAAVQRITGLSVVENQFVFVRGLGERYSNTTLNGASLPSTDFERRVISLDIFPSGLLDSVSIVKTYTPDRSAEFAGGLVEVVPQKLPNRRAFDFSYSLGVNTVTFGEEGLDHPGGDLDWLGLANDSRDLPTAFPNRRVVRGGIYTPELGVSRQELEQLGELLPNVWSGRPADGAPNQGFSLAYGDRFGKLGVTASLNQSHRNQHQDEVQNYYRVEGGELTTFTNYDYRSFASRGSLAGVVGAGYEFTPNQRLTFQAFSTNKGKRETRRFEGFNSDAGRNLRNERLLWLEERLVNTQLAGDHLFGGRTHIEWRVSASRSDRDEPDIRETLYEEIGGAYQLADESQSGLRMFNNLDENTYDVQASWSHFFTNWRGLPAMVKAGPYYSSRQRDFASRRFRFVPLNTIGFDLTQPAEQLFTPATIGSRFELREETRATDFYDGKQTISAGYGMIDLPLASNWRLIGGLRVEHFDQTVNTFDLFDVDVDDVQQVISSQIVETEAFPAANLVYAIRTRQNLRFGFSQTVNRPEFRELSPFEFTDIVGGRAVVGNPDLTRSIIRNFDVRWEWFLGAEEVLAASFFYKDFSDPIERFVEPTSQLRTSFINAKSARNAGFELEARKGLSRNFFAGMNYTFVDSRIELQAFQTNVLTTLSRPLAGTSRHIFNAVVEGRFGAASARLLVNYFGDRIADVGSLGLPDIIETGRPTLDLVYVQRVGRVNLRFSAENLTDEEIRFEQGSKLFRGFRFGRSFNLQVGYGVF